MYVFRYALHYPDHNYSKTTRGMQWHQIENVSPEEEDRLYYQEGLEPPEALEDGAQITQLEVCTPPTAPPPVVVAAAVSAVHSQSHSPVAPLLPMPSAAVVSPHVSPAPVGLVSPHPSLGSSSGSGSSPGRQASPLGAPASGQAMTSPLSLPALVTPTRTPIATGSAAARSPEQSSAVAAAAGSAHHTPVLPAVGRVTTPRVGAGVAAAALGLDMGSSPSKVAIHDIAASLAKSAAEVGMVAEAVNDLMPPTIIVILVYCTLFHV